MENRNKFLYFDQPFFNYVLYKSQNYSSEILADYVSLNYLQPLTEPVGKGMVHFAGGVGNAVPKFAQMKAYVGMLSSHKKQNFTSSEKSLGDEM